MPLLALLALLGQPAFQCTTSSAEILPGGPAVGEALEYEVRYGPLSLGTLELKTMETEPVRGETCFHFSSVLRLRLGFLFRGEYQIDTWCRESDFATIRQEKLTRESRFRSEWTADFDYEAGRIVYSDGDTFALEETARDPLALWQFLRTAGLEPGETLPVYCHTDRRDYRVRFAAGESLKVKTPAGEFDCVRILPEPGTPLGAVYLGRLDSAGTVPVLIETRAGGLKVSASLVRRQEVSRSG